MASQAAGADGPALSIRRLRTLILVALVVGVAVFTGVMFTLVQSLSERLGPQVAADLEWRALRGAHELSRAADIGLAANDAAMVKEAFGAYASSSDVKAIVALDSKDQVLASHGAIAKASAIFAARPGTLVRGDDYVASWAATAIEGSQVGKVAVAVSTQRLSDAEAVLTRVSRTTLIAGLAGVLLGTLVVLFFTRQVSLRDQQLADYARNLERKVEERTRELDERNRGMRLVLDNVAQGLVTIDLHGVMSSERSAILDRWFGALAPGATFGELLARHDSPQADWLAVCLDSVRDGFLSAELCLVQAPVRFTAGAATFSVEYSAIRQGEQVDRILVIISDITERVVRERAERDQGELVALVQQITADRAGFDEFVEDATGLVATLATPVAPALELRLVHTLKGNCGIYGVISVAELCHQIETELIEHPGPLGDPQRAAITEAWRSVTARLALLLGNRRHNIVEVELAELARAIDRARQGMAGRELAAVLTSWSHELLARRFERLGNHAIALARRLGKGELEIAISDDGIRLDAARWAPFWSALVHAVRNAVDHGIERPELRAQTDKPARPKLTFAASRSRGHLMISVSDDGGGIDWDAVRTRANESGIPAGSQAELEQALFRDGMSTAASTTDISGRGVGMAALRDAVVALDGTIEIESTRGAGVTLRFWFPDADGEIITLRTPTRPPPPGRSGAATLGDDAARPPAPLR